MTEPVVRRVLHLVGSAVSDFYADLSRLYAADCLEATDDPTRYAVHLAYVTPDGRWRFPADLGAAAIAAAPPMPVARALARVVALDLDVMVPQMFCGPGMTAYRGLFDVLGIPYVGNTPDVMALGLHKARAKAVVAAAGVRVPVGELLRAGQRPTLTPPVVVKPVDADNSFGVALVRAATGMDAALATASAHGGEVLVEEYVELGREVRCGVLDRDGDLLCLPLEEYRVDRIERPIRRHEDKIRQHAGGGLGLVAKESHEAWIVDVTDPVTAAVWETARRCHRALGCRHYSLHDFRVDPAGRVWFLEAGLYCSFARQSVITMMAAAAGIDVVELFAGAVEAAIGASHQTA